MEASAPKLLNCTREDVFVLVDDERVELPRVPGPTIVSKLGAADTSIEVTVGESTVVLGVRSGEPAFTVAMPPKIDGVVYLVDGETLLRCPHRDDFVVAESFTTDVGVDDFEFTLTSVASALPTITADTQDLDVSSELSGNSTTVE